MRLIYRGSRLHGQGYMTFTSGGEPAAEERVSIDRQCQGVLKGQPQPGSSGILRRLSFEGREIDEVLLLQHGRYLTPVQDEELLTELGRFFDSALAAALVAANQPGTDPTAARSSIREALDRSIAEVARKIAASAPAAIASPPQSTKTGVRARRMPWIGSGIAITVVLAVLVGVFFMSGMTNGSEDRATGSESLPQERPIPRAPAAQISVPNKAIADLVTACWPKAAPGLIEDLTMAYAARNVRSYNDLGRRDRLQLLDQRGREQIAVADAEDKQVCERRKMLWETVQTLRDTRPTADTPNPYKRILQELGLDPEKFALISVANKVWSLGPLPKAPDDCARDHCLPIYDPADVEALRWIDNVYLGIAKSLSDKVPPNEDLHSSKAFGRNEGAKLRQAEVSFRGEIALVGEQIPQPDLMKQFWNCEGKEHRTGCSYPLLKLREEFQNRSPP